MHYELHIRTSLLSSSLPIFTFFQSSIHSLPYFHSPPPPRPPSSTNSNPFSYLPVFTPFRYSSHLPFYLYLLFILACFLSTSLPIFTTPPLPFLIFTPIFTLSRSSSSLPSLPSPVLHLHFILILQHHPIL